MNSFLWTMIVLLWCGCTALSWLAMWGFAEKVYMHCENAQLTFKIATNDMIKWFKDDKTFMVKFILVIAITIILAPLALICVLMANQETCDKYGI